MFSGGDRADENARMELPGSGVYENGVHQRRQAFESIIANLSVVPNSNGTKPEASTVDHRDTTLLDSSTEGGITFTGLLFSVSVHGTRVTPLLAYELFRERIR